MTPHTNVDTGYDARPVEEPLAPRRPAVPAAPGWDHRRAAVSWTHLLPLAVVLALANEFWIVSLRGSIGAIERTSRPFSAWWHETGLLLPVYVLALLAAFAVLQRWFGPRVRGTRAYAVSFAAIVAAATAAGMVLLVASSWFDFVLQKHDLAHMGSMHMTCDGSCTTQRIHATLNLEVKGLWVGLGLMLLTDLVLVGLVVAFRGGDLELARTPRRPGWRLGEGTTLVLAAGLLGAGVIHAAVVPEHLDEWWAAGTFFVVLALVEAVVAAAVLSRDQAVRTVALICAVVASLVPLVVWTVSRTAGLPFGPEAGEREAVGIADVMSCALEITTLVIAVVLLRRGRVTRTWTRTGAAMALAAVLGATLIGLGGSELPGVGAFSDVAPHHVGNELVPEG